MRLLFAIFVLFATSAQGQTLQPDGWDESLKLIEAEDTNRDPKIVEITLEARVASLEIAPGVRTDAWTYNGGLPGPLIRARRGDRIIVHFANKLPQATTVHWHGVQVPIQMDGVPGASQPPVESGQSFKYDFVVPDAGLFWYHPHVMSAAQVGFGLYGPLFVEDPEDTVKVDDELVLMLSDIALDEDGKLHAADSGGILGSLLGREGNHVLVNGRVRPKMTVRDGAQRWRIVNAAKSRYFELVLGDGQLRSRGSLAAARSLIPRPAGWRVSVCASPKQRSLRRRAGPANFSASYERTEHADDFVAVTCP
jgi:FtsP/CotA-like multicopper oxidase with cupredoxin domain